MYVYSLVEPEDIVVVGGEDAGTGATDITDFNAIGDSCMRACMHGGRERG